MIRFAPYAVAALVAAFALAWSYGAGRTAGRAEAVAECAAAQERARRAHEAEVSRIADAAASAEDRALEARETVRSMTDALRRQSRPECPVSDADAERLRAILDAARGPAAEPAAP